MEFKKEMEFSFDESKLEISLRGGYNFRVSEEKATLDTQLTKGSRTITEESKQEVFKVIDNIHLKYGSVSQMIAIFKEVYGERFDEDNDLMFNSDKKVDLFASLETINVWIRLLPVENEYNLYLKCYRK